MNQSSSSGSGWPDIRPVFLLSGSGSSQNVEWDRILQPDILLT